MLEFQRPVNKNMLTAWVNEQLNQGRPRWSLYLYLSKMQSESNDLKEMEAFSKIMGTIEDTIVDRNLKGAELEKNGREDQAIVLYEANILDRFDGSHPYNRLRLLYKNRGDYASAIRVCQAYIDNEGNDIKLCESFRTEITKLQAKLFKS